MWNKIKGIFRKEKNPSLGKAIDYLNDQIDTLENTAFYLTQIKNHRLSDEEKMYYTRANFNLRSLRDELMISNRNKKENKNGRIK